MPETRIVQMGPGEIPLSLEQVVRYAGGSRYALQPALEPVARNMRWEALRLAAPAFAYAIHPVRPEPASDRLRIANGRSLPRLDPTDPHPAQLVTTICTLGPQLEEEVERRSRDGQMLEALFLDAAGVALVEEISLAAHQYLARAARERGLFAGCRRGPGNRTLALSMQQTLFDLIDADAIGVRLQPSGVMKPVKSVSFWVPWSEQPPRKTEFEKCKNCAMTDCHFRARSAMA